MNNKEHSHTQKQQFWLMKTEPSCYAIDDLKREKVGMWDGVRNYQARNMLRDDMRVGDRVLFYHSNIEPIGIVGIAEVVREAYPDPTQFDIKNEHYDAISTKENPRWVVVDVKFIKKFILPCTLASLKNDSFFNDMAVTQKGMRLSIQPVLKKHYERIITQYAS